MTYGVQLVYLGGDIHIPTRMIQVPPDVEDDTELFRERHPGHHVEVVAEVALTDVVFNDGLVTRQPVRKTLLKFVQFAEAVIRDLSSTIT